MKIQNRNFVVIIIIFQHLSRVLYVKKISTNSVPTINKISFMIVPSVRPSFSETATYYNKVKLTVPTLSCIFSNSYNHN